MSIFICMLSTMHNFIIPNTKKRTAHIYAVPFYYKLCFLSFSIYTYFCFCAAETLKAYDAVNFREKCIVTSATNVFTWVNFRSALTVKD